MAYHKRSSVTKDPSLPPSSWKTWTNSLESRVIFQPPYHPQTDRQTEQMNHKIEQYLQVFMNHQQSNWAKWLACTEFSHNDKIQSSIGFSPFYINHGRHTYKRTNPQWEAKSQSAIEFVEHVKKVQEETEAALKHSNKTVKRSYDRRKRDLQKYKLGDKVWLEGKNINMDRPIKKLDDKQHGPFIVKKKVRVSSYKLKLPTTWKKSLPCLQQSLPFSFYTLARQKFYGR